MNDCLEQTSFVLPGEMINRSLRLHRTVAQIKALAANFYELEAEELMTKRRTDRIAHSRQLAMALMREHTSLSLMDIGDHFARDHGTVIHAIKAVKGRCATDDEFRTAYENFSYQVKRLKNA